MTDSWAYLGQSPKFATDYNASTGVHTLKVTGISGGSGTPGGSDTQLQFNSASSFGGISGATSDGTSVTFASGNLKLSGATSGTVVLNAPATGGGTITLPAGSVTLAPTVSPSFTTPVLGVATATSINKVAITAPATGSTLTIADGKTLTASNTLTFTGTDGITVAFGGGLTITAAKVLAVTNTLTLSGTDSTTMTFPTTSATIARTDAAQTFTGVQTFVAPILGTPTSATLTNATGLPAAGVVGTAAILGANTFTALQTITQASANAGILASTGYSLTGSDATGLSNFAGTLNTSGNPSLMKVAITNTASGATTRFLDYLGGASATTSLLRMDMNGNLVAGGSITAAVDILAGANRFVGFNGGSQLKGSANGTTQFSNNAVTNSFSLSSPTATATPTMQLGELDAAAPIAQIFRTQSVVAGTSNTAGVLWTHNASVGTGTGVGGDMLFQVAPAGSTGTTQNTLAAALTLKGTGSVVLGSAAIATNATDGFLYAVSGAGTPTGTPTTFTGRVPIYIDTTNSQLWLFLGGAWKQPKTPAGAALVTWQ